MPRLCEQSRRRGARLVHSSANLEEPIRDAHLDRETVELAHNLRTQLPDGQLPFLCLLGQQGRAKDPQRHNRGDRSHAVAMREVLPEAELRVWSRDPAHAEALALEAHGLACATVAEALAGADVVCTCTASPEPIVALGDLEPGAHVNAVGSSGPWARELAADLVAECSLFVDRRESTVNESGDYLGAVAERGIGPDHILAELGELLVGAHPGRRSDDEITVFKSLGLAVEDLAAATLCVEVARERGIGVEVAF